MRLVRKNVLLEQSQIEALSEMAIRKRTSVNELVRLGVETQLGNQKLQASGEKLIDEVRALFQREEQRLDQVRKELLTDLKLGIEAFNQTSEKHIEKSTQLTKVFVQSLSDALNGEMVSAPQETKPASQSNMDIMLQLERQKQQRLGNKTKPTT